MAIQMGSNERREFLLAGLQRLTGEARVLEQEPLAKHTTFRVGGPADWFVTVETEQELEQLLKFCREQKLPWLLLGNGSNILASDSGFRGVAVCLSGEFEQISMTEDVNSGSLHLTAGAAVLLSRLSHLVGKKGFTGLEFANGIPGTVGGAVFMNAGAYGGEIRDTLVGVTVMTREGKVQKRTAEELLLGYRSSILQNNGELVLKADFCFQVRQRIQIFAIMESYRKARSLKQPLEYPSAGSTFKRPEGHYAGRLIEEAGLSGYRIGGAQVSEKHAGFIINRDNATAAEVYALIMHVQKTVEKASGVRLEPEVRLVGEFV